MDHESMRSLSGAVILWAMGIAAVLYLIRQNWEQIKEICLDDNGRFDPLRGLEKKFSQSGEPQQPEENLTPDAKFMALFMKQKGARMAGFDPEKDYVREHIIFHGRVQGVGFRYQAMYAARTYGLTGWVENLPDGSVEMEVQGTPAGIGRVLTHLGSGHWIRIDDMDVEELPVVPGERGFSVRGY